MERRGARLLVCGRRNEKERPRAIGNHSATVEPHDGEILVFRRLQRFGLSPKYTDSCAGTN